MASLTIMTGTIYICNKENKIDRRIEYEMGSTTGGHVLVSHSSVSQELPERHDV